MATKKISELNALTTPESDDLIAIVDASATETKKITYGNISKHIVNVGTEVEEDSRINFIKSKNLFDKNNVNKLVGYFNEGTPTITSNEFNRTLYLPCDGNTTYTITIPDGTGAYAIGYTTTTPTIGSSVSGVSNNNKTITTGANAKYLVMRYFQTNNATITEQQAFDGIQVEYGETATSYEPYVTNEINIDNEKYTDTLNVGTSVNSKNRVNVLKSKNLLPNNSSTTTTNGITFTKNGDGSITINGTSTSRADLYIFGGSTDNGNYLKIKKGTYSFDRRNLTDGKMFFAFREKTAGTKYETLTNNGAVETMATQDCYIYGVMLGVESGNTVNNLTIYPMLNEGSTALPYEPYVTPSINVDNEEIYSKEDTDIIDITSKLTFVSGWSIDGGKLYKQGKHIFGTIQIKTPSSLPASTNSREVIQLPYTLSSTYMMGGFTAQGDKWSVTNGLAYIYISTNGNFTLTNSSTATFFRLQIDVMEA